MVWWLAPDSPARLGPFYFTAPGTYTVGRRDCTITIPADKTISRLHAELLVEAAAPPEPGKKDQGNLPRCRVLLKDVSKFGTFLNKGSSPQPLNSKADKSAVLIEGDSISFGTTIQSAVRVQYIDLIFCVSQSILAHAEKFRPKLEAIGSYILEEWNSQCTHLLVEESSPITELVIAAVLAKKPVLQLEWLQARRLLQDFGVSRLSIQSTTNIVKVMHLHFSKSGLQFPQGEGISCRLQHLNFTAISVNEKKRYLPTLSMDINGITLPTPIAEPVVRDETLAGYKVFMQKSYPYQNRDLRDLVICAGGLFTSFTSASLKDVTGTVQDRGLLVIPAQHASAKVWLGSKLLPLVKQLHPIGEEQLMRSILSAKLDITSRTFDVENDAASVDSDETVEEDDLEAKDDITSTHPEENVQDIEAIESEEIERAPSLRPFDSWRTAHTRLEPVHGAAADKPRVPVVKIEEASGPGGEIAADIIFADGLLRKDRRVQAKGTQDWAVPNFKCFRKQSHEWESRGEGSTACGNSFSSLVPFANEPYRESANAREIGEYVKQAKKRKEAEKAAEDLFNADRLKRSKVTGAKGLGASAALLRG